MLTVVTRDHAAHVTAPFTLVAGQELDLGTLVLATPGRIVVRAKARTGPLPADAIAGLALLRAGRSAGSVQFTGELGQSGPLEPGTYVLSGHEATGARRMRSSRSRRAGRSSWSSRSSPPGARRSSSRCRRATRAAISSCGSTTRAGT